MRTEDMKRILELREEIIMHDKLDADDKEILSDTEYDMIYSELVDLEDKYPDLITSNSPTQKIYTTVIEGFEEVKHTSPILSQEKAYTEEEVISFMNRANSDVLEEEKMDGLSLLLKYDKHVLIDAITRGNGEVGYRALHIANVMSNVPKRIDFPGRLDVRTEAYIPFAEFERINSTLPEDEKYKNVRNLASGTLKQLDANVAKERNIKAKAFEIVEMENESEYGFENDVERKEFLSKQGFDVVTYHVFKNDDDGRKTLIDYCLNYNEKIRPNLPHMVDGLVLKFVDLNVRKSLGETSKYPKWAIAFKFDSPEATTVILNIKRQTGKSGKITPVAEFEPTYLDGSTITYATLHNDDYIEEKDIRIGDTVFITKAGQVIPKVVRVVLSKRPDSSVPTSKTTTCPVCGSHACKEKKADGDWTVDVFCQNGECESKFINKLKHFISRDAMKIDGLGQKTMEFMIDEDIVSNYTDIYQLSDKAHLFEGIDGWGDRKFEKMVNGIEASKSRSLSQLLLGLSIPKVGVSTAKNLAKEFVSMNNIIEATKDYNSFIERVSSIEDTGEVVAKKLYEYIQEDGRIEMLQELMSLGLKMEEEVIEVVENSITGKTFVVTGKLFTYENRKALEADIEKFGGKSSGSVSTKTDYLINNDTTSTSGKNKKAQDLNIPIISEDEFVNMIK